MGRDGGTIGDYPNSTHGSDDHHKKTKHVVQKPEKNSNLKPYYWIRKVENLIIGSEKL